MIHRNSHLLKLGLYQLIVTILAVNAAFSWGSTGHKIINLKAVMHLPASMASLKADSMFYYNHASDADGRKNYSDTALFQEAFRHYIDIDIYPNYHSLPHSLDSMIMLYGRSNVRDNGTLPWAIVLTFDSLSAQLARNNIAKAESSMADLGHYIGDGHQPLHNTENYDGDMTGNSGIHSRYETSMINKFQTSLVINWDSVRYVASPLDYAFEFIYHSNSLVDSVLAADNYAKAATGWNGSGSPPSAYYDTLWKKTMNFTKDQFQRATVALASYWYTAWVNAQAALYDTITASSVGNGAISPSGQVVVSLGTNKTFTFTPQTGYHVDSVKIDGVKVDSLASYTFHSVNSNHTITASFSINRYSITASAGAHGTLVPSGSITVTYDNNQAFTISPDSGYEVDAVYIDSEPVDSTSGYTFINVRGNHSINVTFKGIPRLFQYHVSEKWNMISLPAKVEDARKFALFPSASSNAFAYEGTYLPTDSLQHGQGYWLKFDNAQDIGFTGTVLEDDTVSVYAGWNMLGSLSDTISVSCIIPLSTSVQSPYFGYENGYQSSGDILPGKAYWVKVSDDGELVMKKCTTVREKIGYPAASKGVSGK